MSITSSATTHTEFSPFSLGRYQVVAPLGAGGMARVYLGELYGAAGFARPLVIKLIHDMHAENPRFVNMFIEEANLCAHLDHTNIARVHALEEDHGRMYMVMEYLDGGDVQNLMAALPGQLEVHLALYVMWSVARGLAHAHTAVSSSGAALRITHRDISPANVLLSSTGDVKITDFGVAKALGRRSDTQHGEVKGKLAYMAPEILGGGAVDQRCDLFSAGVMLWELLTGTRLFDAATDLNVMRAVLDMPIPAPSTLNPEVSPAVDALAMRAVERQPDRRFQTAAEMADALHSAMLPRVPKKLAADLAALVKTHVRVLGGRELAELPRPPDLRRHSEVTGSLRTQRTPLAAHAAGLPVTHVSGIRSLLMSHAQATTPPNGRLALLDLSAAPPPAKRRTLSMPALPDLLVAGAPAVLPTGPVDVMALWNVIRRPGAPRQLMVGMRDSEPLTLSALGRLLVIDHTCTLPIAGELPTLTSLPGESLRAFLERTSDQRGSGLVAVRALHTRAYGAIAFSAGRLEYVFLPSSPLLLLERLTAHGGTALLGNVLHRVIVERRPLWQVVTAQKIVTGAEFRGHADAHSAARLAEMAGWCSALLFYAGLRVLYAFPPPMVTVRSAVSGIAVPARASV